MCDVDGEGPAVWSEAWRRARKPHRCIACHETITPGDLYWAFSGLWDGSWSSGKQCARCQAIFEFLRSNTRDPVDLALDCGEIWEGDPAAHDMALWTRGDAQAWAQEQRAA